MKEIKLSHGKVAIVDDEDFEELSKYKWRYQKPSAGGKTGYAWRMTSCRLGKQRNVRMHRVILDAPPGAEVDHKDRNGLNNLRENLRLATRSQNNSNWPRNNKTGFRGVYYSARIRKYRAEIKVNKKFLHLGVFVNSIEAARAYNEAAIRLHGDFAVLNNV